MKIIKVKNLNALPQAVKYLKAAIYPKRKLALYGDMGAGKTTIVRAFCAALGAPDVVSSPTFSLINQYGYKSEDGSEQLIHHLDLYRLKTQEEALDIGIEDVLEDPWYCIIEWPQIIENLLPENIVKIRIEIAGKTQRNIVIL